MNEPKKQPTTRPGHTEDGAPGKPEKGPKKPDAEKTDGTPDWGIDPKTDS